MDYVRRHNHVQLKNTEDYLRSMTIARAASIVRQDSPGLNNQVPLIADGLISAETSEENGETGTTPKKSPRISSNVSRIRSSFTGVHFKRNVFPTTREHKTARLFFETSWLYLLFFTLSSCSSFCRLHGSCFWSLMRTFCSTRTRLPPANEMLPRISRTGTLSLIKYVP